jgi:hypothetical protein
MLELKLNTFRDKVKNGRMVRFWNSPDQLMVAMMQAITRAISTYPAHGWIRGDEVANEDVVRRYMQLREHYDDLLEKYNTEIERTSEKLDNLATLDELFEFRYTFEHGFETQSGEISMIWSEILKIIGPKFYCQRTSSTISSDINSYIEQSHPLLSDVAVNQMDADTIKIHFYALGILDIQAAEAKGGGFLEYVSLTEKGKTELIKVMAVRTENSSTVISSAHAAAAVSPNQ